MEKIGIYNYELNIDQLLLENLKETIPGNLNAAMANYQDIYDTVVMKKPGFDFSQNDVEPQSEDEEEPKETSKTTVPDDDVLDGEDLFDMGDNVEFENKETEVSIKAAKLAAKKAKIEARTQNEDLEDFAADMGDEFRTTSINQEAEKFIKMLNNRNKNLLKVDAFLKDIRAAFQYLSYASRADILFYIVYEKLLTLGMMKGKLRPKDYDSLVKSAVPLVQTASSNFGEDYPRMLKAVEDYCKSFNPSKSSSNIQKLKTFFGALKKENILFFTELVSENNSSLDVDQTSVNILGSFGQLKNVFVSSYFYRFLEYGHDEYLEKEKERAENSKQKKSKKMKNQTGGYYEDENEHDIDQDAYSNYYSMEDDFL